MINCNDYERRSHDGTEGLENRKKYPDSIRW